MSLSDDYLAVTDANRFLVEHCGKTLEDIRRGYIGSAHAINRAIAEYTDCWEAIRILRKQVEDLKKEQAESAAEIGSLQERVRRMADFLTVLREERKESLEAKTEPQDG